MSLLDIPLRDLHEELGASFGDFAGWSVPMVYKSVLEEHLSVRKNVGVFDVSHMGRLLVEGEGALETLELLIPKKVRKLSPGRSIMPTAMLNESGGFVDDVSVYMLGEKRFLVVCNAVNREKVISWINKHSVSGARVRDITFDTVMLALQGPRSPEVFGSLIDFDLSGLVPGRFVSKVSVAGSETLIVGGGGWTGEKGFEIIAGVEEGRKIFKAILDKGVKPVGIVSRDTLRIEMGYLLYGSDIDESTTPLEARYWVFSYSKKGYIGYEALMKQLVEGVKRIRVGFVMDKPGPIPRHGDPVYLFDKKIGVITSGTHSPVLGRNIAMGYVDSGHALFGAKVEVEVRGKRRKAHIVDFPFI